MPLTPEDRLPEDHLSEDRLDQILGQIISEEKDREEAQEVTNDYFDSLQPFIDHSAKMPQSDKTSRSDHSVSHDAHSFESTFESATDEMDEKNEHGQRLSDEMTAVRSNDARDASQDSLRNNDNPPHASKASLSQTSRRPKHDSAKKPKRKPAAGDAQKRESSRDSSRERLFDVPKEPSFNLGDYDFRSFKQQHSRFDETFVSDEDVSFYRNGVRHEFFLELDNRTETNGAIVDKIVNYINYARNNPDDEILMTVAYADGSVPTKNIGRYSPIPRKIGNVIGRFLDSSIVDPDSGQTFYIPTLLQHTPNLRVSVSEVSEAYQDPADFLSGRCHVLDALDSVHRFVDYVNLQSDYDWDCSFEESPEFSCLKKIISAATNGQGSATEADKAAESNLLPRDAESAIFLDRENRYLKGIWKAVDQSLVKSYLPHIGTITYSHRLEFKTYKQSVILGMEHDLDTAVQLFAESARAKKTKGLAAPLVVYPTRERTLSALCASVISKLFYWPSIWSPRLPLMLQPVTAIDSDKRLESDLRLVLDQYQASIFRFFTTGGLNKSDLKKGKKYDPDLLPSFAPHPGLLSVDDLSSPVRSKDDLRDDIPDEDENMSAPPRSYEELQALAGSIGDAGAFVKQLRVDEVPLSVYQALLSRWPEGTFSPELIQSRSFMKHDVYAPPSHADLDLIASHVFYPNSVLPFARIKPLK